MSISEVKMSSVLLYARINTDISKDNEANTFLSAEYRTEEVTAVSCENVYLWASLIQRPPTLDTYQSKQWVLTWWKNKTVDSVTDQRHCLISSMWWDHQIRRSHWRPAVQAGLQDIKERLMCCVVLTLSALFTLLSSSVCQTSQFTRMSNEWPVWWSALFHWALTIEGSCGIIKSLWNNLTDSQDQDQEVRKYSGSNICPESDLTKPSRRNPAVKLQPCRTWAGLWRIWQLREI